MKIIQKNGRRKFEITTVGIEGGIRNGMGSKGYPFLGLF